MPRLLFVAGVLMAALLVTAQNTPQAGQQPVFRTETRIVQLSIVATGRNGKPAASLRPEEVEVRENGRVQKLLSWEPAVRPQTPAVEAPKQERPATAPDQPAAQLSLPPAPRYIVLAIDQSSTKNENRAEAVAAIGEWIDRHMDPGDQVALASLDLSTKMWTMFTRDKDELKAALEKMKRQASQGNDDGMLGDLIDRLRQCKEGNVGADRCGVAAANAYKAMEENLCQRRQGLLRALIEIVAAYPDEKRVVYFGDGFLTNPGLLALKAYELFFSGGQRAGLAAHDQDSMRAVTSAAVRANVTFYAVSTRGLLADPQTGDPNGPVAMAARSVRWGAPRGNAPFDPNAVYGLYSEHYQAVSDSLRILANQTGGRAFMDNNDFVAAAQSAVGDLEATYYASYAPDDLTLDGAYRKIEVRALRPGIEVRTRAGYFAIPARRLNMGVRFTTSPASWPKLASPSAVH